jgi:hypothetical protein
MTAHAPPPARYAVKVIRVRAEDSPNVRRGLYLRTEGLAPDDRAVLPGVLTWSEYLYRRATLDPARASVGLDGLFYEGPELKLFPPDWLAHACRLHDSLENSRRRGVRGMGVDPGEGGAETALYVVDDHGVLDRFAERTPDTSVIEGLITDAARRNGVPAHRVCIDRGGGGKQIADRLRARGLQVRTVAFGEAASAEPRRWRALFGTRVDEQERKYEYRNRRAQLYGELSELCDPRNGGFALPPADAELLRQLDVMPKAYDEEGRLWLPPKGKRDEKDTRRTITDMLGCSPDRADALALAAHGLLAREPKTPGAS